MATETQRAEQLLGQLDAVLTSLATVSPAEMDPLRLVDGLARLVDAETRLRGVQSGWLASAETSDAVVAATGRTPRSWLIEDLHLSGADSGRRVRLAQGLAERPALRSAIGAAEITTDQAGAILHALRGVPVPHVEAVEDALLGIARDGGMLDVQRAVDEVRARVGGETADERALRRYDERSVTLDETFAGTGSLCGSLTSECRETLKVALHAAGGLPGPDDIRNPWQRRHDALQEIAAFYLTHVDTAAPEAGERPRVVVTMSYDLLRADLQASGVDGGLLASLPDGVFDSGAPVSAATVRRMACDAGILPAVLGGPSDTLDLGRSARSFSLGIRRAAKLRDGGRCARSGCRRRIVDCHHIEWWCRGGSSDLVNAVWLCAFHHWLVHEGGWAIRRLGAGRYVFTDPVGREHGPPPDTGDPPSRRPAA